MGEENRGSSGSSTAMIVVAILGSLLLVGCCGVAGFVGAVFTIQSVNEARFMEFQRNKQEVQKAHGGIRQDMDTMIQIPDAPPEVPPSEIAPIPDPPVVEENKE